MTACVSLIDQVRDAMRAARELYHGSARAAALRELAERLDEPLRVAVGGPPDAGSTTLVEALRAALEAERVKAHADQPAVRLIDTSGAGHDRQHAEDPGPRGRPGGAGRRVDTAAAASPGGRAATRGSRRGTGPG